MSTASETHIPAAGGVVSGSKSTKSESKRPSSVVEIDSNTKIEDAIEILVNSGILSAPVYDAKHSQYLGFADLSDFLAMIRGVEMLKKIIPKSKIRNQYLNIHGVNIDLNESTSGDGLDLPVHKLLKQGTKCAPWFPIAKWEADLKTVTAALAKEVSPPWTPCRRVPLLGPKLRVVDILSQSQLVRDIYDAVVAPGSGAEPPVFIQTPRTNPKLGTRGLITVDIKKPVGEAFDKIVANAISAVGITDASQGGKLVGVISNKDVGPFIRIRKAYVEGGMQGEDPLEMSVATFITQARAIVGAQGITRSELVVVTLDTSVQDIIAFMADSKTHRVFIVDEDAKPLGIVSVSDIVKLLLNEDLPWPSETIEKHMAAKAAV